MELFAIICLALIIVAIIAFNTKIWVLTLKSNDGSLTMWAIILTIIFACLIVFLGYWLIIWGGQYFVNMGWWYFDQQ